MTKRWLLVLSPLCLSLFGCPATVGTSGMVSVPPDAGRTCETYCEDLGMDLGAVAIMANVVGCICEPKGGGSATGSASTAAGMASIMLQQKQQQQQQSAG